jgi:hypothetical protein
MAQLERLYSQNQRCDSHLTFTLQAFELHLRQERLIHPERRDATRRRSYSSVPHFLAIVNYKLVSIRARSRFEVRKAINPGHSVDLRYRCLRSRQSGGQDVSVTAYVGNSNEMAGRNNRSRQEPSPDQIDNTPGQIGNPLPISRQAQPPEQLYRGDTLTELFYDFTFTTTPFLPTPHPSPTPPPPLPLPSPPLPPFHALSGSMSSQRTTGRCEINHLPWRLGRRYSPHSAGENSPCLLHGGIAADARRRAAFATSLTNLKTTSRSIDPQGMPFPSFLRSFFPSFLLSFVPSFLRSFHPFTR